MMSDRVWHLLLPNRIFLFLEAREDEEVLGNAFAYLWVLDSAVALSAWARPAFDMLDIPTAGWSKSRT